MPAGEVYQAVEGSNGELGFYVVSDGSGRPYRVRVRPPCFFGMGALSRMLAGHGRGHRGDFRHDQHDWRRMRPLRMPPRKLRAATIARGAFAGAASGNYRRLLG